MERPSSALDGIRVIDLTQHGAAPMTASLLAQWGAEVIHVEHPIGGDASRGFQKEGVAAFQKHRVNYVWELTNYNKKSLTADLAQREGREIIYRLAANSDVFLSNLRPRQVEKFEMHYETLKKVNPKIIYANLTGYGPKGPDADAPAWDISAYYARSGITYMLSDPEGAPIWTRPALGDFPAGMVCACGIMVALFAREKLGIGQEVYTSLFNSGVWSLMFDIQGSLLTRQDPPEQRRELTPNPLFNSYRTKDGRWLHIGLLHPEAYWPVFCQALDKEGLEKDPRFDSIQNRAENSIALIRIIDEVFAKRTVQEWVERLTELGLIFSLVQKPSELIDDPQARANDFFMPVNHPTYGPIELVSAPIKLSETPGTFKMPAPELGQHTEEILLELGYSRDDMSILRDKKVI
jgi:crotonobetainyl-CoA:carnitine CoA-transferase CaiB-like acyl-CoA transferase